MQGKKSSILLVLRTLEEYSDRQNPLTYQQIIDIINSNYGIELERKSVASSIKILSDDFDYDINKVKNAGVFLDQRLFEPSEVTFLTNAIFGFKPISSNFATQLSNKVLSVLSKNYRKNYKTIYKCADVDRAKSSSFFDSIDVISHAIRHNRMIQFKYLSYDENGNEIFRKKKDGDENYIVTPYHLLNSRGFCYLLALPKHNKDTKVEDLTTFRLDYLKEIGEVPGSIGDDIKTLPMYKDGFDIAKFYNEHIYMFSSDKPITAKLEILNHDAVKYVKEWFGKNAAIKKEQGKTIAIIKANPDGFFFWIMQYSEHFVLLEPKELVERVRKAANNILKRYK